MGRRGSVARGRSVGTPETFPDGGTRTFTPPGPNSGGDGDWVLLLSA